LTEQRKHDHKIPNTLPIYYSVYLVIVGPSKTKWEQSRTGKFPSSIDRRMNVEQAVAIDVWDVCSALFINNLLIYSYRKRIVPHVNAISANQ